MTNPTTSTRPVVAAIETLAQDVRLALRLMRRDPAFTLTALATLALGIGLNTAIFSVAYGVLWRPLPYPHPDRLIVISAAQPTDTGVKTFSTWAPVSYDGLRTRVTTLDELAAYDSVDAQITGHGEPLQVPGLDVSPNFFATLDVTPALGRAFLTGDAASEDDNRVIVSDHLWRTTLGADPAIVGQSITIDGVPRTVLGVLPPDFTFQPVIRGGATSGVDVFRLNRWPGDTGRSAFLFLLGRMKPDVSAEQTSAELTAIVNDASIIPAGALATQGRLRADVHTRVQVVGLQEYGTASMRTLLFVLLGAVSFVLVIACVNVANLQMARLVARRGELSVRLALGAGRRRIVRQLLTEAVVLSVVGAALGMLLAWVAIRLTLPLVPDALLPRLGSVGIDARVLAFCLGLSIVATLVVRLVPALRVSGGAFGESAALHAGAARTVGDRSGERLRTLLVAAQMAMTLVLLVGAGLLIHSFVRQTSMPTGFASDSRDGALEVVRVTLPERLSNPPDRVHTFAGGVLDRVRHLPGVTSASIVNSVPFAMMFIQGDYEVEGRPKSALDVGIPKIGAGYFKTMGIPLLAGREFTAADVAGAPNVAIVSDRVVRESFPGGPREAIGRRVRIWGNDQWLTVVGVAADIRQRGFTEDVQPMIYAPFAQDRSPFLRFVSFVARTTEPAAAARGIREEIHRAAPDLPILSSVTMDAAMEASVAEPRFRMVLLGLFALAAMLVATCGLYGLMAYAVSERRREIGVRMALGATRGDVLRLVITRAVRIVAIGLVIGLLGAAGVTRVLQTFLFGVTPTDPLVFTAVTLLLFAVGLLAAWLPARRATHIDPWKALGTD
jgi:predicted permease